METYKITKGKWSCLKNFPNFNDAEAFAASLGQGYVVSVSDVKIIEDDTVSKIEDAIKFGNSLIILFRVDNVQYEKDNNITITTTESFDLMNKFASIISLCSVGAIKEVQAVLPSITIDTIFTQVRKDKYQDLIDNYLQN